MPSSTFPTVLQAPLLALRRTGIVTRVLPPDRVATILLAALVVEIRAAARAAPLLLEEGFERRSRVDLTSARPACEAGHMRILAKGHLAAGVQVRTACGDYVGWVMRARTGCAQDRPRVAGRVAERLLGQVVAKRVAPFPPGATRSVCSGAFSWAQPRRKRRALRRRSRRWARPDKPSSVPRNGTTRITPFAWPLPLSLSFP